MEECSLVVNAGSSSLKFCVYRRSGQQPWTLGARGQISGIGTAAKLSVKDAGGASLADQSLGKEVADVRGATATLAGWLRERMAGTRVTGVGHRVVHGGTRYARPCLVTPAVIADLRALVPLAPLHQPHNVSAIEDVARRMPDVPQVACFDTGFHQEQGPLAKLVPLPQQLRDAGVQRYGFHGISYEYIASVLPQVAPGIADGRIIVAHLGSGASLCALRRRRSIDSTFGFTALDGLCMGTRPGSLDPGVVLHLFQTLGMTPKDVETLLYKQSGLLGISGISNDMRALEASQEPAARLAINYFVYQAAKHIGALAAVLGGLDAIVFTAGIGENSVLIRQRICEACTWLGVVLDEEANSRNEPCISRHDSRVPVWVVPTNEELMIARHMDALLRPGA